MLSSRYAWRLLLALRLRARRAEARHRACAAFYGQRTAGGLRARASFAESSESRAGRSWTERACLVIHPQADTTTSVSWLPEDIGALSPLVVTGSAAHLHRALSPRPCCRQGHRRRARRAMLPTRTPSASTLRPAAFDQADSIELLLSLPSFGTLRAEDSTTDGQPSSRARLGLSWLFLDLLNRGCHGHLRGTPPATS